MTAEQDRLNPVHSILFSQHKPENISHSPFYPLVERFGVHIDFRSFITVEGITARDFRKNHINLEERNAVIFTSRHAAENYFRLCEEMRVKISEDTKYFCQNEALANYLQRFIHYRKRKVFFGQRSIDELHENMLRYKKKDKFFVPITNISEPSLTEFLRTNEFDFIEGVTHQTLSSDLSDLADITYDMLVFFSPQGITSLYENFPDFKQNKTRICGAGAATCKAILDRGLILDINPATESGSITTVLENYVAQANRKVGV